MVWVDYTHVNELTLWTSVIQNNFFVGYPLARLCCTYLQVSLISRAVYHFWITRFYSVWSVILEWYLPNWKVKLYSVPLYWRYLHQTWRWILLLLSFNSSSSFASALLGFTFLFGNLWMIFFTMDLRIVTVFSVVFVSIVGLAAGALKGNNVCTQVHRWVLGMLNEEYMGNIMSLMSVNIGN